MGRLNYIIKRVLQIIPVLLVISVLIFSLLRLIGGDPATLVLGDRATPGAIAALREQMGLNRPLTTQYVLFMRDFLTGSLGVSLVYKRPVLELLSIRLPVTLKLTFFSALLSLLISFPTGYVAGRYKDRAPDQIIRISALTFISMPNFWIGLLFMSFFSVYLNILPAGGWVDDTLWAQFVCLILPAVTSCLMTTALLMRNIRNSVVDVSEMDYVDFAKSKGITASAVRNRHVLRNSLISTVTLFSMRVAYMLGGSVIVETVFSLPGIGQLLVKSIFGRDYIVVQSVVLLFSLLVLVINLLTDVVYSFIDPRVSY